MSAVQGRIGRYLRPRRGGERTPSSPVDLDRDIKVFTYTLGDDYRSTQDLVLPSQTYEAIKTHFETRHCTADPLEADFFFVPLNLIQFQFRNEDPKKAIASLGYRAKKKKNHILVATGDFSNRSRKNHNGEAYAKLYRWLDDFILLALESTSDLVPGQDIGIIPYNTLSAHPTFNTNDRRYLYGFLGELNHQFLPASHIRRRLVDLPASEDVYIGGHLTDQVRSDLYESYPSSDDYELVSRNSVFTLCPAGHGRWTYRFFQAIQWGSIPVLLSDDYIKPFNNEIPYDDFCITVKEQGFGLLDETLRGLPEGRVAEYQAQLRINQRRFTPQMFFRYLDAGLKARRSSLLEAGSSSKRQH